MYEKKLNILVTGGNGQLGMELRRLAKASHNNYIFSDISEIDNLETICLDITDKEAITLICKSEKVDMIINCAAYTNVDAAQKDIEMAEKLNSIAPSYLAEICASLQKPFIHISTDYVFGGRCNTPFKENMIPEPVNVYGATKLKGENYVLRQNANSLIIRTSWLYSSYGKNFVKTILSVAEKKSNISVVFDQLGSPTYARDLAIFIYQLAEEPDKLKAGIYHYSNEGVASWYDFAQEICSLAGISCNIRACRSAEYPTEAERPAYSVLDKSKIIKDFDIQIPYWKHSLRDCINTIKSSS